MAVYLGFSFLCLSGCRPMLLVYTSAVSFRTPAPALRAAADSRAAAARLDSAEEPAREPARNVLGTALSCCCADVHGSGIGTGFYRDGYCSTGPDDAGRHTVCIEATEKFLAVSAAVGNPLHQPIPQFMFPGVRPGDRWCLCASRYAQLIELERESAVRGEDGEPVTGFVPRIHIRATHERSLEHMDLEARSAARPCGGFAPRSPLAACRSGPPLASRGRGGGAGGAVPPGGDARSAAAHGLS